MYVLVVVEVGYYSVWKLVLRFLFARVALVETENIEKEEIGVASSSRRKRAADSRRTLHAMRTMIHSFAIVFLKLVRVSVLRNGRITSIDSVVAALH